MRILKQHHEKLPAAKKGIKGLKRVFSKKGEYILEAAVIAPMFMLAVLALIGIIPVISNSENLVFSATDEMRREAAVCALHPSAARMPVRLEGRAKGENRWLKHLYITGYRYRFSHGNMEDLIEIHLQAVHGVHDPLGCFDHIRVPAVITGRAFTGRVRTGGAADSFQDDSRMVYIFPEEGIRYHSGSCQHVRACCKMVPLSDKIRKAYHPCPNCRAKTAATGAPVYVFSRAGEAYHYGSCRSVTRWCTEISLKQEKAQGYTACRTCGGGE